MSSVSDGKLSAVTIVDRSDALVATNLGDDVVMMDVDRGAYYGLEKVAARIWSLVERPVSVRSICDRLLEEYEVPPERCEQEVTAFIDEMLREGVLRIVG
jgi:hypothetical protein